MSKKKSLRGSERLVYFLNGLFSIALLISYLLPHISPIKAAKISILSLLFPLLFFTNLLFLVYWLVKGNKRLLLSLIVLLIGYSFLDGLFKFSGKEIIRNDDFKLMSYNVKMLNHYHWSKDDSIPKKMERFITNERPEILLLQEYYDDKNTTFSYPYQYVEMKSKTNKFGLAVFSKYPIINQGSLDFKNSANNIVFCDLKMKNDTIRVYNVHLESLKLNPTKENFGEKTSEKLLSRLATTFKKQAEQMEIFTAHLKNWKKKVIIAGDFNNTAFSWVYHQIKEDRLDAFEEAGQGFGKTFDYLFPLRIDFILLNNSFSVNKYQTHKVNYSDHFPISVHLSFP